MSEREAKREQFNDKPASTRKLLVPVILLLVACAAGGAWFLTGQSAVGGPEVVAADQDGKIRFAAADFADGKARFYRLERQAGPVDFFVVKSHDGVIRSAFDTCDVCYKERKGYRQDGNEMVWRGAPHRKREPKIRPSLARQCVLLWRRSITAPSSREFRHGC